MFFKKIFATIIIFLILVHSFGPAVLFADDITPTPTPDQVDTQSDEVTPTPTLDSFADPTPTPEDLNVDASNSADVNNNVSSNSDTGDNNIAPTPTPTPDTILDIQSDTNNGNNDSNTTSDSTCSGPASQSISTGDAVSETEVDNNVNTNSINSTLGYQSVDINGTQNGDIDLSGSTQDLTNPTTSDGSASANNASISNSATIDNNISSQAISGDNTATGSANITTGDAISIITLLNTVNTNLVNSTLEIIALNIFGIVNGNIILPDAPGTDCTGCGSSENVTNTAVVNNNVTSDATSGKNNINGAGNITTGDTFSIVNLINLINSNYIGVNITQIFINVFGSWNGDFLGWGDIPGVDGSTLNLGSTPCPGCSTNSTIDNNASVNNNVYSFALTGGNTLNGKGEIVTGNAYSGVSIFNFINSNFINSSGHFAFINIFGELNGDIGGKSNFPKQQDPVVNDNSSTDETGLGAFSVDQTNNVNNYVLPGDTVTFFIHVKNTGIAKIHNAGLDLSLVRNGHDVGGTFISLGDIDPGKSLKVTTGLVLKKNAHPGFYTAVANVTGTSNGQTVTGSGMSEFTVFGNGSLSNSGVNNQVKTLSKEIFAAKSNLPSNVSGESSLFGFEILFALILGYFFTKALKNIKSIKEGLKSESVLQKLKSIQAILL